MTIVRTGTSATSSTAPISRRCSMNSLRGRPIMGRADGGTAHFLITMIIGRRSRCIEIDAATNGGVVGRVTIVVTLSTSSSPSPGVIEAMLSIGWQVAPA